MLDYGTVAGEMTLTDFDDFSWYGLFLDNIEKFSDQKS